MGDEHVQFAPLETLVDPKRSIAYGIVQPGQHVDDGVPIIRVTDIRDGRIATDSPLRVAPEIASKYGRTMLRGGELLLTLVGTIGETAIVPNELAGWNTARAVAVIPVTPDPGARWVKYALQTPGVRQRMFTRLNTTVQATLNLGEVAKLPIPLPSASTRAAILNILGSLDDKLELDRRTAETLESMARAVFKSWFIDFDPVHAKAERRTPVGMDAETAELFPSEFQDSERGPIPKGWSRQTLTDVSSYMRRGIGPAYADEGVIVINQKCVRDGHVDFAKARRHDVGRKPVGEHRLEIRDILVNSTGTGTLGRVAQIWRMPEDEMIVDSHVTVVRASAGVDSCWLGLLLRSSEPEIEGMAQGSTGQTELPRAALGNMGIVVPPLHVQRVFGDVAGALLAKCSHILESRETLTRLRDALLPRLLSGALPIRDAEQFLP